MAHHEHIRVPFCQVLAFFFETFFIERLVHEAKRRDDRAPVMLGNERVLSFLAKVEVVRGNPHHKTIAQSRRTLKNAEVAYVKEVERAKRQYCPSLAQGSSLLGFLDSFVVLDINAR